MLKTKARSCDETMETKSGSGKTLTFLVLTLFTAGIFAFMTLFFYKAVPSEAAAPRQTQAPSVVLHTVSKMDLGARQEYIGKVEAIQVVDVRPHISGEIAKAHFKEGALVGEGDLLFTLDAVEYQAVVELRKAELAKAEAKFSTASKYHERLKNVGKSGVSVSDIDTAAGSAAQAKAEVAQAKAQLRLAQIELDHTRIKAPIAGRIGKVNVTKGNYVTPTSGILASIVQVNPIRISFALPDRDYLRIQRLSRTMENEAFNATLRLADDTAYSASGERDFEDNVVDGQTGTIMMRLRFKNDQGALIPGSMVHVEIAPSSPVMGILIPQEAIIADRQGDFVYVVDADSVARKRNVTLGIEAGSMRQVTSGLQEGESIVLRGHQSVQNGIQVNLAPPNPGRDTQNFPNTRKNS